MEAGIGRLAALSMDALAGVVDLYPWFGAARLELCRRVAALGGNDWGIKEYADAAMYVRSRTKVSDILRSVNRKPFSGEDVGKVLKTYVTQVIPDTPPAQEGEFDGQVSQARPTDPSELPIRQRPAAQTETLATAAPEAGPYRRTVRSIGGDFFSQKDYDEVRRGEDDYFSGFVADRSDDTSDRVWEDPELGFCTETLAGIYAEQGYFAEAKKIYSRLVLRYPEKSAYFASLIQKIDTSITN